MEITTAKAPPDRGPLPRQVVVLGWVSFFADVSTEMVYPLIPLFVIGVLGASRTTLGGIEGSAQLVVAFMAAWAGWRSDARGRRLPYVRLGYALPVLGKGLMAAATGWPMVLAGRLTDRFGKGLRSSPRDALIADAAGGPIRGRAFGFHRAMDTAGAVVGTLLAAALLWWFTGAPADGLAGGASVAAATHADAWTFRALFAVAAALGLVSLACTFLIHEPPRRATGPTAPHAADAPGRPRGAAPYWRTLALLLVFSLANSSDLFLFLRANDLGFSPAAVMLAYALFNVTYALGSYPAGAISDRFGRWPVIALGWAIYAAVYAGFALAGAAWLWPLFALYGLSTALTDGVGKALIADHTPSERRGTALGVFFMANGVVTLIASLVAGILWDRIGPTAVFWFGACAAAAALAMIPLLRPPVPPIDERRSRSW